MLKILAEVNRKRIQNRRKIGLNGEGVTIKDRFNQANKMECENVRRM